MHIAARTETAQQRSAIHAALIQRNRLVAVLRIGLPAIAAVILLGLLLQLYVGSLIDDFGFADIRIDRDNLVVEAPAYSGVGADGTIYSVEAASARAAIGSMDVIRLEQAVIGMKQPSGAEFTATAASAQLKTMDQLVTIDGETRITASNGMSGTLTDAVVDVPAQTLATGGAADIVFADGTSLKARTMSYDGMSLLWKFDGVTLVFPATPGEATVALRPGAGLGTGEAPAP